MFILFVESKSRYVLAILTCNGNLLFVRKWRNLWPLCNENVTQKQQSSHDRHFLYRSPYRFSFSFQRNWAQILQKILRYLINGINRIRNIRNNTAIFQEITVIALNYWLLLKQIQDHFYSIWLLWWFRTRDIFDWNSIECKVKHIQLQLRT